MPALVRLTLPLIPGAAINRPTRFSTAQHRRASSDSGGQQCDGSGKRCPPKRSDHRFADQKSESKVVARCAGLLTALAGVKCIDPKLVTLVYALQSFKLLVLLDDRKLAELEQLPGLPIASWRMFCNRLLNNT